jgi:O-antigen ligase
MMSLAQNDSPIEGIPVWILLFALIPQGLTVSVGGRTPSVLIVDLCLISIILLFTWQRLFGSFRFNTPDFWLRLFVYSYCFANLVSTLTSLLDVTRSIVAIKVFMFGYLAYLIVTSTVRSERGLMRSLYALTVWSGFVSVMLIYQFVTSWQIELDKADVGVSMGQSNYLAAMLVPLLPISISLLVSEQGLLKRTFIGVMCTVTLFGLLITMSRGALGSLLIAAVCTVPLMFKAGLRWRRLLIVIAIIAVLSLAIPTSLLTTNYELMAMRAQNPDYTRLDLWGVAWSEFLRNPALGVGPNCIYFYNELLMHVPNRHTHNFVLNNLAEVGLAGSVPFFLLIATFVRRSYRLCVDAQAERRWRVLGLGAFVGLLATLAHGMVEPTFPGPEYSIVFWTFVGIIFALQQRAHLGQSWSSSASAPLPTSPMVQGGSLPA